VSRPSVMRERSLSASLVERLRLVWRRHHGGEIALLPGMRHWRGWRSAGGEARAVTYGIIAVSTLALVVRALSRHRGDMTG
jgi:hypothetical protein